MTTAAIRHPGEMRWETRLLAVLALFLTALGIAVCYSAASYLPKWQVEASQQLTAAVIGGVVFMVASQIDYQLWRTLAKPMFYLTLLALAPIAVVGVLWHNKVAPGAIGKFFPLLNGAHRWINIGVSIQVTEIARFTLAAWVARRAADLGNHIRDLQEGVIPVVAGIVAVMVLSIAEPSVSMAGVLGIIGFAIIFTAGARITHLAAPIVVGSVGLAGVMIFDPVRQARALTFLTSARLCNPDEQACESLIGFGNGGLFGTGFGNGSQKLGHMPFAYSDFIWSVIGEEFGFVGIVLLVICFAVFCWLGFRIAKTARDSFGTYLATGLTVAVGITAFLHAAVGMRLIPTTGLTLPFLSAGRVSLVLYMFSAGVLVSIGKQRGRPARTR